MNKSELLDRCSQILDNLTVVKGYLLSKEYGKKVNYMIAISQALNEMEALMCQIIDDIKETSDKS